ncbi:glycoside hydrolase family 15 protein [Micromonospora zamorensis]|uniref:glycoside hydrolase family 15 protein n=1 Tax=Micromonospora zamorensis TaxID=709883 RepID=UPI00368D4980
MRFRFDCHPRFNYGRDPYELEVHPEGDVFRSPTLTLSIAPFKDSERKFDARGIRRDADGVSASFTLHAGDIGGVVLETACPHAPRAMSTEEACDLLAETRDYWRRVLSWVALDRAIRIAHRRGRPGDTARWATERDAIYQQVMTCGFNQERRAFVQHYGSDILDASLLAMPGLNIISPTDPMWESTLRAMDAELASDSLVYRYDPKASPDGLAGTEGTFNMCTFWYVQALAQAGRLDDARLTFEKMLTYASPLGLYSEEIAPTGEQIGNFPQAFSHLSLISTAAHLDDLLDKEQC